MTRKFAVFDIDGTVIRWQLYHSIVSELARRGHLTPESTQAIHDARMTWKRRVHTESFRDYEMILVEAYGDALKDLKVRDYLATVDTVFNEYKDQVYTYTRDLIRDLKAKNYLLFAISGSQAEIIDKLATYYGFDEAVGASFEQVNGHFTGKGLSSPVGQKDKVLQHLLAKYNATTNGSIAVGDSEGDIAMLEIVEQPIAFNPSKKLFDEATKRGWQVVIERKNMAYRLEARDGQYVLAQTND